MKAIIFNMDDSEYLTGFLVQHPAVCAQGGSKEEVEEKLGRFAKLYFDYMSKNSSIVESELITI